MRVGVFPIGRREHAHTHFAIHPTSRRQKRTRSWWSHERPAQTPMNGPWQRSHMEFAGSDMPIFGGCTMRKT